MPAKDTVSKKRGKAKMKVAEKRKQLMDQMKNNLDFKVAIIQELIPLGLEHLAEELKKEVGELAGKRYEHDSEKVR